MSRSRAISQLVAGAPTALDRLVEIAGAIDDDPDFAGSMAAALALKASLASPEFTGVPTAPTPGDTDDSTQIANTSWVLARISEATIVGDELDAAGLGSSHWTPINLAVGSTTDIGSIASPRVAINGSGATITSLGTQVDRLRFVSFDGVNTLVHNGTSLILPGGANIQTRAGDTAIFMSGSSGNWRCHHYQRADGAPLGFTANNTAALGGLVPAADKVPYFTGASAAALADFTAYGRSLVAVADEAALKALINLEAADILAALLTVDGADSTLDADLLDGQQGSYYADIPARLGFTPLNKAGDALTGRLRTAAGAAMGNNGVATATSDLGELEVRGNGTGAAVLAFLRNTFGVYLGLDADNQLKIGGWSLGANAYKIWHEGNDGPSSGLNADLLDGSHASDFAAAVHDHDSRYYTESEVNSLLASKVSSVVVNNVEAGRVIGITASISGTQLILTVTHEGITGGGGGGGE
ncbi:MAG: hypothetical protein ACM31O_01595 [Bacteroidota bacterium]